MSQKQPYIRIDVPIVKLCIECGGALERRKFVDSWDDDGKPEDINEDWYCQKCDIRWLREDGPHDFYDQ